ncbi:hypothetical protein I317_01051 [Kwoniella heveanensis CBS 569]|nr:hypothetical protein I317_01051 [Kwoniella heveanensis CBS 569]
MSHQPRRAHPLAARPNIRYGNPPQSPALLSHSTITFLASWRGQLLVCTVVLIVGAVYFFIRDPIESWSRRRREKISRMREGELIRMEQKAEESEEKEDVGGSGTLGTGSLKIGARERGREKRKEGKKRGGSILRVSSSATGSDANLGPPSTATTNPSSVESSPAPPISSSTRKHIATSPNKSKRILPATPIHKSPSIRIRKATDESTPSASTSVLATPSRNRPPPPIIVPRPPTIISPTPLEPWEIPLPASPMAGPSRVNGNKHQFLLSDDGVEGLEVSDEFDGASESAQSSKQEELKEKRKSDGFSIFPEDGYLPVQLSTTAGSGSGKKKKRKAKAGQTNGYTSATNTQQTTSAQGKSLASSSEMINGDQDIVMEIQGNSSSSSQARPRHRHQRTSSIALLPNLTADQLREIVEKRDETIDQLRAEIGTAKAEEAKAKDEAMRCKLNEDRARSDYDRMKKAGGRGEGDARRREAELQARLSQLQHMNNALLNRLGTYETVLRETGIILPPPPSPIPMHIPQSSPLQMPTSPFAPSPVPGRSASMGGFIPYPSPGMYPSPMLQPNPHYPVHPHAHSSSPTPFRRLSGLQNAFVSSPGLEDGLNGSLTPGLTGFPMDIGSSTMPIGLGHPTSYGGPEVSQDRERRRQSIESSVLKKKVKEMTITSEGELKQPIEEEEDLQSGDRIEIPIVSNGPSSQSGSGSGPKSGFGSESMSEPNSSASNSHPSSPRSAASALPPPTNGETLAIDQNGVSTHSLNVSTSTVKTQVTSSSGNGLRVILDGERGNVYYASEFERAEASGAQDSEQEVSHTGTESQEQSVSGDNGTTGGSMPSGIDKKGEAHGDTEDNQEAGGDKTFEPIFASLAHTPEEVGHIRSQAEKYRERGRSVSSLSATASASGSAHLNGDGKAVEFSSLSPSPSKSSVPLRT